MKQTVVITIPNMTEGWAKSAILPAIAAIKPQPGATKPVVKVRAPSVFVTWASRRLREADTASESWVFVRQLVERRGGTIEG